MNRIKFHEKVNVLIAMVWLVNGLYCKVLNQVPRHQQIVGEILGKDHASIFTVAIGFGEVAIAIWIFWGILRKINIWVQVILVVVMNILEFLLVPELLLWGKWNLVFAILFAQIVFMNYKYWNHLISQHE